jgi:outer membrane protein assembly factor BamB
MSSPSVFGGILYVGSWDSRVYALNATTGDAVWNYTTGSSIDSSPCIYNGRVYIASEDGRAYCLNATTGEHIWDTFLESGQMLFPSPVVAYDRVYFGGGTENCCYCLNATSGDILWRMGGYTLSSPAVFNEKVYVASAGDLYCLNSTTGENIWNYTGMNIEASSPAVTDGKVYVGGNKVYCFDAESGALIWNNTEAADCIDSSPAVAYGRVYIGSISSVVYCLNATTGEHLWNYTTGMGMVSSPAVADGKVYVGSYDHRLYCLNATSGECVWSYLTGDWVLSSPSVAYGRVFVGSFDRKVYALGEIHDVAVTSMNNSKNGCKPRPTIGQGQTLSVNFTAENQGEYIEVFNISVYANWTSINVTAVTLNPGENRTLDFAWNTSGFEYGNYTLKAVADALLLETDVYDNAQFDWIVITIPGDLNGDFSVSLQDLVILANAYGTQANHDPPGTGLHQWNPNADIDSNGVVGLSDLVIMALHYGQHYP